MENLIKRLFEYIKAKKISIRQFEIAVGFSNGSLSSQIKSNKSIGSDRLEKILHTYTDLSPDWLMTGEGEMIKSNNSSFLSEPNLEYKKKVIPLIQIDAIAGIGAGEIQVMEYESEKFVVPTFAGADFLISVRGSSMNPKYNSGDIVACKKLSLDTFFQWNKVYVLDTDQGVLIKRVKKSLIEHHLLIVSENIQYEPFDLHREKINSLALVMGVIRLE